MSFLSAIIRKLDGGRWGFSKRNREMTSINNELAPTALADAFLKLGRSGFQATAAAAAMRDSISRLGSVVGGAGVSKENLEALNRVGSIVGVDREELDAMSRALTYAMPRTVHVSRTGSTGTTGTTGLSVTQATSEPEPEPEKERLLIRKIRFKRRELL